jgi:hypothetical protein
MVAPHNNSVVSKGIPDTDIEGAQWRRNHLMRLPTAIGALATFVGVGFISQVASCNIHELGHGVMATALGWRVQQINLCLPGGGSVEYAHVGTWAGNAQGYAGGIAAALFLFSLYVVVFSKRRLPLRSPFWWAAGLATVVFIGPQLVIAVLEGAAGPGVDYTEWFTRSPEVFVPLLVGSALLVAAAYTRRWRSVWRPDDAKPHRVIRTG